MFREISEGVPPIDGTHVKTAHFSSVILQGRSGELYVEIISLSRNGSLNHSSIRRVPAGTGDLTGAELSRSLFLLSLEERVKKGKTAKQALTDSTIPTPEDEAEADRRFNSFWHL